jgi:DNA mismatch repair protein MutS
LEREHSLTAPTALPLFAAAEPPAPEPPPEPPPEPAAPDPLRAALAGLDPDRLTPREALESLYQLRALIPVAKQHE